MRSATFRNVALGILALAAAYHLGARSAGAAFGDTITHMELDPNGGTMVMTANGDTYVRYGGNLNWGPYSGPVTYMGNFWGGGPTPTETQSFGQIKARYSK